MRNADTCFRLTLLSIVLTTAVHPAAQTPVVGGGEQDLVRSVDCIAAGKDFPGVAVPFGMVQFGPDKNEATNASGWTGASNTIRGFSLTHLSGSGCGSMGNFPFMPHVGAVSSSPASSPASYMSSYSTVSSIPGYFDMTFTDGMRVELTATNRAGLARFTFPSTSEASILALVSEQIRETYDAQVHVVDNRTITGWVDGGGFCHVDNWYTVYFHAEFDRDFSSSGTWSGGTLTGDGTTASGTQCGAYATFDASSDTDVLMRVGISYVSVANARGNLQAECSTWDFTAVADSAATRWNRLLNRIQVTSEGPDSLNAKQVFYSYLYRALIHPSTFSDANGEYIGFDDAIHVADTFTMYSNFSGWDTYRTQCQLVALLAPDQAADMAQSLVMMAQQGSGDGAFPRWVVANEETGIMSGDPGTIIVANTWQFGARIFDADAALAAMRVGGEVDNAEADNGVRPRGDLDHYLFYGHTPNSVSVPQELMAVDFSIAQFALRAFNDTALHDRYMRRTANWRSLYNPSTQLLESRDASGAFVTGGFTEGTAAQYRWMQPWNYRGLFDTLGGNSVAIALMDDFFTELNTGYGGAYANVGNEPCMHTPWMYNWAGAPYKTQALVRRVMDELFADGTAPGDDDLGTMAAWYVFASIGLYPSIPGLGGFAVSTPQFAEIRLTLPATGVTFTIDGGSTTDPYISAATLDGSSLQTPWLSVEDVLAGKSLAFVTSTTPNLSWGASPAHAPPSYNLHRTWDNLAEGAGATASGQCAANEAGPNAVDRHLGTKWCHNTTGPKWLELNLGSTQTIGRWVVAHAGVGETGGARNTRDFELQRWDGGQWVTVDSVRGNYQNITDRTVSALTTDRVRLHISNSGDDNAARIYEVALYAPSEDLPVSVVPMASHRSVGQPWLSVRNGCLVFGAAEPVAGLLTLATLTGRAVWEQQRCLSRAPTRVPVPRGLACGCYLATVRTAGVSRSVRVYVSP